MFPIDTLACLQVDTSWLLQHGWSQPPGSRKLLYWRRSDALQAPPAAHVRTQQRDAARCVLLSLASQSLNNHALPTLPQAGGAERAGARGPPPRTGRDRQRLPAARRRRPPYDIAEPRRWRAVFRLMHGYGEWMQLSVFQCRLTRARHVELLARLTSTVSLADDHVLVVDIGAAENVEPKVQSGRGLRGPRGFPVRGGRR
ncbi:MAG: CRISPR-associated endonuclease Cas2 [Betaproteobacteria bacterium]|nr:CRISPR-associated endonuclease Cas2 [Betaproteobacteria bacterium]